MPLKEPQQLVWDDRLPEDDRQLIEELNRSLDRLNGLRAVQINRAGHFARSKIAWKLATYQHALLHRIVALMDGAAVAWNYRCTLSAILSGRALMETVAVMSEMERRVAALLTREDLGGLDSVGQNGLFASRDAIWLEEHPNTKAISVLTYIDKFDRQIEGFRAHYDRLSERCHPNSLGHNFMFSKLDRSDGTVDYVDERDPDRNGHTIVASLIPFQLVEGMMTRLDRLIMDVSDLHHRIAPIGDAEAGNSSL